MRRLLLSVIVLAAIVPVAAQGGGARLALTTRPSPLGLGQNFFEVTVQDAKGQPVANAEVSLLLVMPADPKTKHPEMRTQGQLNNVGGGKYNGIAIVTMAGAWDVTVSAMQKGKQIGQRTTRMTAFLTSPKKGAAAKSESDTNVHAK